MDNKVLIKDIENCGLINKEPWKSFGIKCSKIGGKPALFKHINMNKERQI